MAPCSQKYSKKACETALNFVIGKLDEFSEVKNMKLQKSYVAALSEEISEAKRILEWRLYDIRCATGEEPVRLVKNGKKKNWSEQRDEEGVQKGNENVKCNTNDASPNSAISTQECEDSEKDQEILS